MTKYNDFVSSCCFSGQKAPKCEKVMSLSHCENPLSPTRPVQTSLSERFGSPIKGSVKRKLFDDLKGAAAEPIKIRDGPEPMETEEMNPPTRNSKKNSTELFFRKIYHLASRRIQHLSDRLHFSKNLIQTIFTLFEQCVVEHNFLFKGRHIDQVHINELLRNIQKPSKIVFSRETCLVKV